MILTNNKKLLAAIIAEIVITAASYERMWNNPAPNEFIAFSIAALVAFVYGLTNFRATSVWLKIALILVFLCGIGVFGFWAYMIAWVSILSSSS